MKDMNVAVQSYTRQQVDSDDLPTQTAIDEGRDILEAAKQRVAAIRGDVRAQVKDATLRDLSGLLYSRVGKPKPQKVSETVWILSQDNILEWGQDLDAFESALAAVDVSEPDVDPFGGMRIEMEWLASRSDLGEFIHTWMPRASRNRHGGVGDMRIKNVWRVKRLDSTTPFQREVSRIAKERQNFRGKTERPERQPRTRTDLSPVDKKLYEAANVGMMFHGTRSVNVTGILREGLRLPKQLVGVQITGAMFGGGLYWADDWKKSAGYCSLASSYWAGGGGKVRGRQAFMFVADVVCGTPYVAPGPRGFTGPPRGCHSVFGKAGTSQVMNNEWIVYQAPQHDLKYLVEFSA